MELDAGSSMAVGEQLWHWLAFLDLVTLGSEDYWRRQLESALVGGANNYNRLLKYHRCI